MANAQMPDEFYDVVCHHLPPEQPVGSKGGRPRIRDRLVLKVIWFVLASGCRWEDVPQEMGCSGRTAHRRLRAWEELGVWAHTCMSTCFACCDRLTNSTRTWPLWTA
jgi:transposase